MTGGNAFFTDAERALHAEVEGDWDRQHPVEPPRLFDDDLLTAEDEEDDRDDEDDWDEDDWDDDDDEDDWGEEAVDGEAKG